MRKGSTRLLAGLLLAVCIGSVAAGTETWTKTYGAGLDDMAYDALLLEDGGYLIVGESIVEYEPQLITHLRLLRLDADGEVVWERTGVGDRLGSGSSVVAVGDGYVIAGTVQSDDADDAEILLLKVDADGNEIWWNRYGTPLNEHGGRLIRTEDGGYVIVGNCVDPHDIVADPGAAGYAGFAGRSNAYLVRTDAAGDEVWSRRFETDDNVIASGGSMAAGGGIVVLTYVLRYPVDDNDIRLFKVDGDGNELWSRTWEEGKASGYDLIATSDGGFLVSGMRSFPEDPARAKSDALLIKVDAEGNEIWLATYGEPHMVETAHAVAETADGSYVCVGWQERDLYTWTDDILLAAHDRDGGLLWQSLTRSATHNTYGRILEHPDGSYVVVGSAARPGRSFRVQVIKIDPDGT
jgi:hypothetical protein